MKNLPAAQQCPLLEDIDDSDIIPDIYSLDRALSKGWVRGVDVGSDRG